MPLFLSNQLVRAARFGLLLVVLGGTNPAFGQHQEHKEHDQSDAFWAAKARNHTGRYFISAGELKAQSPADLDDLGEWSAVIEWPHVPVSGANLPDGRVITWSSNEADSFPAGPEFTFAATWNLETGAFVETPNHVHDMFCSHTVLLADGRLLVNGGRNHVKTTSIFDFTTNSWSQAASMNHGRWYPTTVAMPDGTVFTASGSGQPNAENTAELLTEGSGWSVLENVDWTPIAQALGFESFWWPHLFVDPAGDLFHAGPTDRMSRVTTGGEGSLTDLGSWLPDAWYSKHAAVAMYDEGKILIAGGAGTALADPSSNRALIMDINGPTPVVTEIGPMAHPRRFASAVVLPNGEVLVVGGNTTGFKFSDDGTVLPAEIWNPQTLEWRTVASISEPRNYHSIALLLEDGTVLSAGGGLCGGGCSANHQDGQTFSPPYLFDAAGVAQIRPSITDAPGAIGYSQTFTAVASGDVAYFSLVKASATTHAVNTDQRFLRMEIESTVGNAHQLTSHANRNVLTPGYWMMFAVDSNGVPSKAHSILISLDLSLSLLPLSNQISLEAETVSVQINSAVPDGQTVSYAVTGLPPGLAINPATGLISGTTGVGSAGLYEVDVTASADGMTDEGSFRWSVRAGGTGQILREWWTGVGGNDISDLTESSRYPNSPSSTSYPTSFEAPSNWSDSYGTRMRGFLHPLETGTYRFWIATDNQGELLLSTSSSPSDAQIIASVPGWVSSREWDKFSEQQSAEVFLEAGRLYYIEALHKEGGGGDNLAVAWETPSRLQEVIPGSFLSPFNGAPAMATPPDQVHLMGATVSLAIQASDPEGDVLSYAASGLPTGLAIDPNSGVISGTVTQAGIFISSVSAGDASTVTTVTFDWTVESNLAPLEVVAVSSWPVRTNDVADLGLTVSGPPVTSVDWSFGDGTSLSGGESVSHAYSAPGRYSVTAVVHADGESAQVSFFQNVHAPLAAQQPTRSSSVVVDQTGRVWNVNPDNNSVTVTDAGGLSTLAEIPVGIEPSSLAISSTGNVFVVNTGSADISVLSSSSLTQQGSFDLPRGSRPHGLVLTRDANTAFVTLEASGKLARIDMISGAINLSSPQGPWLRGLSLTGDENQVIVTRFVTPPVPGESTQSVSTAGGGEILFFRAADLSLDNTVTLAYNDVTDTPDGARGIANYLAMPTISPDGARLWIPSKFDNIFRGGLRDGLSREHDRMVRGGLSVIDLTTGAEIVAERLDIDDQSHPVASVFGPRGNVLFVAHAGSRSVTVIDPTLGQAITRISTGLAPTGLAMSASGRTLYVHNYLDRSMQSFDVRELTEGGAGIEVLPRGTVSTVTVESLLAELLKGKQLFNDSFDDRLSGQDYLSCASCHAGGAQDGRVWDFTDGGEGLRNTIDLRGRAGTDHGPVHWTANFDEIHDFENDIRAVFGGTGLMSDQDFTATQNTLGPLKAGRSADLDALSAYVTSLANAGTSPFRNPDGTLTAQALTGLEVFRNADCASCHSGRRFTDSPLLVLHDIGTLRASSGSRLGGVLTGLDTPTLRGLWSSGPYLHDGSAATIGDAVQAHDGVTLSAAEVSALVAYLQSIDDDEIAAPNTGEPPTMASVAEQSSLLNTPVTLALSATEPDGDAVVFTAGGLPSGLDISPDGVISGTPTASGVFSVTARATDVDGSDAVQFIWRVTQTEVPVVSTCYLVADNSSAPDVVTMLVDGVETLIGPTGTSDIEGIAYSSALGVLFAANADRLGSISLGDGSFNPLARFGSGDGAAGGGRAFEDVDGLAFDRQSGTLFGSVSNPGEEDFLIAIDPLSGIAIANFFGAGVDYIVVESAAGVNNLDDIAVDPGTSVLYAVGTGGGATRLFTIDAGSGETSVIGVLNQEVEGLGFTSDGRLFGTTGDDGRTVVEIDKQTGSVATIATIGAGGTDYESIDCLGPDAQQVFAGRVFEDVDADGAFGALDAGYGGARIDLYRDTNADGAIDGSDTFLRFVTTATDGTYQMLLGGLGSFAARVDYTSMPLGATPLAQNIAAATYTSMGQVDDDNLFPFALDRTNSDLFCYLVADEGSGLGDGDVLTRINKGSLIETAIGPTGTSVVEAIAFDPQQTTLYAANGTRFGRIDLTTGLFTEIGEFGQGRGSAGNVQFTDIDGLTFDPTTGVLYGSVRRSGAPDLLIQIDPATGQAAAGAFGGDDYVVVEAIDSRTDVDDIAIDPMDGLMYAILNADSGGGRLAVVDRETGATTLVQDLNDGSLEGLTFDGDGTLLATRGSSFQEIVVLSRANGSISVLTSIGVGGHQDYEAISCLTNQTNTTSGRVYADANGSGGFDSRDVVLPGVSVGLFRDVDEDGGLSEGDVLLSSETTDFSGGYSFRTASNGSFVIAAVESEYFSGARVHGVSFSSFGEMDPDNDFVMSLGSATSAAAPVVLPEAFSLKAAYPNPFNPITTIGFELPSSVHVRIDVFDLTGRLAGMLVDDVMSAGTHQVRFDASRLPSGIYFYRMISDGQVQTKSVVLLR
ncbi:MAG: YVTN family beta-propeller protein [Rhodothermales bacterium]|jgi:YVTN family beta-propeller protein